MPFIDGPMIWLEDARTERQREVRAQLFEMSVNIANQSRPVDEIVAAYGFYTKTPYVSPSRPECSPRPTPRGSQPRST